jgi:putative ABC transport system substrate-binding protein
VAALLLQAAFSGFFPGIAGAQAPRLIGVLTPGGDFGATVDGLREGLVQLGFVEGKQIAFMVEDTKMESIDPVKSAAKLLDAKPQMIVTVGTSHTAAAKQVIHSIPIVFMVLADPVQGGFVASFSSSKNNLTGVSNSVASLSGKRLELLKEMVPRIKHPLAIVTTTEAVSQKIYPIVSEAAQKLGLQLVRRDVASKADLEKVLADMPKGSVDSMVLVPGILLRQNIALLVDKANKEHLPLGVHTEELVRKGALVSYGEDNRLIGIQAAKMVAKILKGMAPADLPIESPDRPILAVNRTTAKIIGVKISGEFLERVDRFVE